MYNNHYIRVENDIIIHGFSDAFEQPQENDICIAEEAGRQFEFLGQTNPPLRNERGQFMYKWVDGEAVERTQEELDEEWNQRPPAPPTETEILGQQIVSLELENLTLKQDNEVLGNQIVNLELRLLSLEGVS